MLGNLYEDVKTTKCDDLQNIKQGNKAIKQNNEIRVTTTGKKLCGKVLSAFILGHLRLFHNVQKHLDRTKFISLNYFQINYPSLRNCGGDGSVLHYCSFCNPRSIL